MDVYVLLFEIFLGKVIRNGPASAQQSEGISEKRISRNQRIKLVERIQFLPPAKLCAVIRMRRRSQFDTGNRIPVHARAQDRPIIIAIQVQIRNSLAARDFRPVNEYVAGIFDPDEHGICSSETDCSHFQMAVERVLPGIRLDLVFGIVGKKFHATPPYEH